MKTYQILILSIIYCGCNFTYENNTNHDASLEQLRRETDSLKRELSALKKNVAQKDSLVESTMPSLTSTKDTVSKTPVLPTVKPVEKKTAPRQIKEKKKSDTTFYFYTNTKKISVRIDPRNEQGKLKIRFYNPKGEIMFEQEDVRLSYSVSTDIKEFHSNGAVKNIVIHMNPGASIHWYETLISFDTDNTPLWKEEITYPITLEGMMNNKSYWDKTKKQWIKQEVVIEQPYVK